MGTGSPADPFDGFGAQSGYYTDVETGLVLCTLRFYDPARGRWLTRDPIGSAGGVNLYGYVRNNPLRGIDPLGLDGYWSQVGQVFQGYGDALIGLVRAPYDTAVFLGTYADNPGAGGTAIVGGLGQFWHGLTEGNAREFGNSFGTVLITAAMLAPAPKNVPAPKDVVLGSAGRATPMSGQILMNAKYTGYAATNRWWANKMGEVYMHEGQHQTLTLGCGTYSLRAGRSVLYNTNPVWRIAEEVWADSRVGTLQPWHYYRNNYGFRVYDLIPLGWGLYFWLDWLLK